MHQLNQPKGKLGEMLAVNYLKKKGYLIIKRNFLARYGEIDVICLYRDALIFVEVKTRWGNEFGSPLEAITPYKLRALIKTVEFFKMLHPDLPDKMQIDVVAIQLDDQSKLTKIEHLQNVTS